MERTECPYHCKSGKVFNPALRIWQDCPHCTGVLSELSSSQPTAEAEELQDMLRIPDMYKGAVFNLDTFVEAQAYSIFVPATFDIVLSQLKIILKSASEGRRLNESCYFYTGIYSDVLGYVYHTLQTAVKHGLSAVPFVSLLDLKGIRDSTVQTGRIYNNISYLDFTTADICFISVTASVDSAEAAVLADLLSERARHGLSTQVFGYWSEQSLKKSKNGLHFLISDANKLSILHPYEIKTQARLNAERQQITQPSFPGVENGKFVSNAGATQSKGGSLASPATISGSQPATFGGQPLSSTNLGIPPMNSVIPPIGLSGFTKPSTLGTVAQADTSVAANIGGTMLDKIRQEDKT